MSGQRRRGPMGGRGMRPTEKAKDFKGAMGKLFRYMGRYKLRFVMVFIFAIAGTIFNIAGPKILGKATTELYTGLVATEPEALISRRSARSFCGRWDCMWQAHAFPLSRAGS